MLAIAAQTSSHSTANVARSWLRHTCLLRAVLLRARAAHCTDCLQLRCSTLRNNTCSEGESNNPVHSTFTCKEANTTWTIGVVTYPFTSLPRVYVLYTKPGSHTFLSVESSTWFAEHHWAHFRRIHCWKMIFSELFINQRMPNHICGEKKNTKRNPNENNRTIIAWRFWLPINYNSIQLHDNLRFHLWNHSCY